MKIIFEKVLEWLIGKNPGIGLLVMIVACAIWLTTIIKDFQYNLDRVELRLGSFDEHLTATDLAVKDINERQLPEILTEIKEMKGELVEIKLFMKKIDTYLSTKDKDYPK